MSEFEPGTVVCTIGVQQRIDEDPVLEEVFGGFLQRHLSGDWGDLDDEDREMNDESLRMEKEGKPTDRLFSCYEYNGGRIYIITEWDRSATTLLLPEEYRNHKSPRGTGGDSQVMIMTAIQMTMFAFESKTKAEGPVWLEDYDGKHMIAYRMDAEAMVEDLNRMPSGKGSWLRCLEVDHSRSYEAQFKDWDACIWLQRGIGMKKMVMSDGAVMDCIDPHPYRWHYFNGKQVHPWTYEQVREMWIDNDALHLKTDSGEYMAEIRPDSEIDRYDNHPYDPSFDLEHFAIECYRHRIPREMMAWRGHYMYGTPVLRPFIRGISHEDAKRIDPMGNIPGGMVRNPEFDQICACAEMIGIDLKLSYDVPVLKNLATYPVEESCRTCLRRRSKNRDKESVCWKNDQQTCCSGYIWDRVTQTKRNSGTNSQKYVQED